MAIVDDFKRMASADLFKEAADPARFVGHPFYFDYSTVRVLVNDKWKENVGGIPEGAFLVAVFHGAQQREVVLLRVLRQTKLPSDSEVVAAMVDHYKETTSQLDTYTRYEFMFSGLECRVLGSFYEKDGAVNFGADVDNFYSPNNYSVYKPTGRVLELLVNFRDGTRIPGGTGDQRVGSVRYSSSRRHVDQEAEVVALQAQCHVSLQLRWHRTPVRRPFRSAFCASAGASVLERTLAIGSGS